MIVLEHVTVSYGSGTGRIFAASDVSIRVEEGAVLQNLGDDYRDYAATHKRLVPFMW